MRMCFSAKHQPGEYLRSTKDLVKHKLTQSSTKITPTHIAFAADNNNVVRQCYTAALNAGARPNGSPDWREGCDCFNAAVLDFDGNTIEFIRRQPTSCSAEPDAAPPTEINQARSTWEGRASQIGDDVQSLSSKVSKAKSRWDTVTDLASTSSKSRQPAPGISRSKTEPASSNNGSKNIVGTLLGAAAGAAVAYAMVQSEKDSSQKESEFARSRVPSSRGSRPRSNYEKTTSTRISSRTPRLRQKAPLAIEAPDYSDNDDDLYGGVLNRYSQSRRPLPPARSRTYDAIEWAPMSVAPRQNDRYSMKRSSTLPVDFPDDYPSGSRTAPGSHRTSRRGSLEDGSQLKRHDSGVSMYSHRSRRSFDGGRRKSASNVSTLKPSRRGSTYESAAEVPLPPSRTHSYISAAGMPLPSSRATSYITAAQPSSRRSRATESRSRELSEDSDGIGDVATLGPEDSISCVDFSTKSKKEKSRRSDKSSYRSSKRSEASSQQTVRPANPTTSSRHSAQTLPVRPRSQYMSRDGKRSIMSYN
jgi:hypothetical protein